MQISEPQMDKRSFEEFVQEAASLLQHGNFLVLAERFGYAMAYGREPASAIEADLSSALEERGSAERLPFVEIKYFTEESTERTGLVAATSPGFEWRIDLEFNQPKEIGREEAFYRGTDHRLPA